MHIDVLVAPSIDLIYQSHQERLLGNTSVMTKGAFFLGQTYNYRPMCTVISKRLHEWSILWTLGKCKTCGKNLAGQSFKLKIQKGVNWCSLPEVSAFGCNESGIFFSLRVCVFFLRPGWKAGDFSGNETAWNVDCDSVCGHGEIFIFVSHREAIAPNYQASAAVIVLSRRRFSFLSNDGLTWPWNSDMSDVKKTINKEIQLPEWALSCAGTNSCRYV